MAAHRREMRMMTEVLRDAGAEDWFEEMVREETGNDPFWLGDGDSDGSEPYELDTVEEDTEKIELQNRVALLEQRLAEPVSHLRFIQAVEGALTLRGVTKEMDDLRAENAKLKQRVEQLEAEKVADS